MDIGSLGKAKVVTKLIEMGYDVFLEFDGKSPFDLVIHKDDVLERVEVKYTETRNRTNTGWVVQLKKVRPNRTRNKIVNFDKSKLEKLIVFIKPLNTVVLFEAKDIKVTSALSIFDKDL